jgi:hypothetical protein
MAVVQISKIQVRRGQKNSNSGIPQLSSAEFAWALDTQELFIGNGSVAEGAPYVGNTKIITEHDNLLELASSYQFAADDTSITLSVPRSLQGKLDEIQVSVADFGAVGDGSTDCVTAFQTAFTQLFRNVNSNYKKVLIVPNGNYLFTSDLAIPNGVILKGETQLGAVLNIGANNIRFITSTGLEVANFNSTNRPQNINISNLTIQRTTGQVTITGVANSVIEGVRFFGDYELGDSASLTTTPAAVYWENNLNDTKVTNVKFKECIFEQNAIAVKCNQTSTVSTTVFFENSKFFVCDTGIYINGLATQGNEWQVNECDFEEIANQAFRSSNGQGTLIQRCKFRKVGNVSSLSSTPNDYMIYFGEKIGNQVIESSSDRQQLAGVSTSLTTASYTEVYNAARVSFVDRVNANIEIFDDFRPLAVFSAENKFTIINYCLRLGTYVRHGQLWISVGSDLSGFENASDVTVTDNFQYSPNFITSVGGDLMTNFEFSVSLTSNRTTDDSTLGTNPDTLVLLYKNPTPGVQGSISFDVTYGV